MESVNEYKCGICENCQLRKLGIQVRHVVKLSDTDQFQREYEKRRGEMEAAGLPKDEASVKALAAAAEKFGKSHYTTCNVASNDEEEEEDDDDEMKVSYMQFGPRDREDGEDDEEEEEEEEDEDEDK